MNNWTPTTEQLKGWAKRNITMHPPSTRLARYVLKQRAEMAADPPSDTVRLLPAKPEVIVLCGSSRFVAEMAMIAWGLERDEGIITMGLHLLPSDYTECEDHLAEFEGAAEKLDELHWRKIDLANRIFVVNIGGYIGDSTRQEIEYAERTGKRVTYLEAADE